MTLEPLTTDRRRQQTRDYLLEAAAQVFAEQGFHGASLDQVAAVAGFTKGAVYSNFEHSDVPPEARLGDFVGLIRHEMEQMPDNWGALSLEFTVYALRNPVARERLSELEEEDIRAIAEIIEEGRKDRGIDNEVGAENAARIIVALFQGIGLMRVIKPETLRPDLLEDAMNFVARGLAVVP
jgi:AcrR family transcriptional regulator